MTQPAPDPPACPHRRVAHRPAALGREAGPTRDYYRVTQLGYCQDCGHPVVRRTPLVALGDWETVAGATPGPRRLRRTG